MRKEKLLLSVFLAIVLIGLVAFVIAENNSVSINNSGENGTVCTMDAKMCPDGSYVGRIGPNCKFAPCPRENNESENDTSTDNEDENGTEHPLVGASCGTVTPGYQNQCCINKGYAGWDAENFTCIGETPRERGDGVGEPRMLGTERPLFMWNGSEICEPWNCTKWSACVNGTQTRDCVKVADCNASEKKHLLGSSCGTVTPGYENECCVNKGYTGWDAENFTCIGEKNKYGEIHPKITKDCFEKERIMHHNNSFECPEECNCTGSVIKCELASGRTMTIYAGNSGNVIVQIQGINSSTNVTLYKADGRIYGIFNGNITKEIHLPDEIKEMLQNHTHTRLYNESINLTDEGYYQIEGHKKSRLFWIVPVREHTTAQIDAETGAVVKTRNPWWGFLARDERD
jgi:hypothetical protein